MFVFGAGVGLASSQLAERDHVVRRRQGIQRGRRDAGHRQYLGASLGTALIGAALLAGLASGLSERVGANTALSEQDRAAISAKADEGVPVATDEQVDEALAQTDLSPEDQEEVADDYADARLQALRRSLLLAGLLVLGGLLLVRRLPADPLARAPS